MSSLLSGAHLLYHESRFWKFAEAGMPRKEDFSCWTVCSCEGEVVGGVWMMVNEKENGEGLQDRLRCDTICKQKISQKTTLTKIPYPLQE